MMKKSILFSTKTIGTFEANNRVVLAPMTRSRTAQPDDIPTELMAEYYAQRASAGFIITEATQISPQGKGYSFTPGMFTTEQVAGWKKSLKQFIEKKGILFLSCGMLEESPMLHFISMDYRLHHLQLHLMHKYGLWVKMVLAVWWIAQFHGRYQDKILKTSFKITVMRLATR